MVMSTSVFPHARGAKRLVASAVIFGLSTAASLAADDRLAKVIDSYGCQVSEALKTLGSTPTAVAEPFLTVAVTSKVAKQIECRFEDGRTRLLCQTAPISKDKAGDGSFYPISKRGSAALAKLGFAMGEADGTFQRSVDFEPTGEVRSVAELMLSALYGAYGMRDPETGLSLIAAEDSLTDLHAIAACPGKHTVWGIALR
jgi:hypothetical protein